MSGPWEGVERWVLVKVWWWWLYLHMGRVPHFHGGGDPNISEKSWESFEKHCFWGPKKFAHVFSVSVRLFWSRETLGGCSPSIVLMTYRFVWGDPPEKLDAPQKNQGGKPPHVNPGHTQFIYGWHGQMGRERGIRGSATFKGITTTIHQNDLVWHSMGTFLRFFI